LIFWFFWFFELFYHLLHFLWIAHQHIVSRNQGTVNNGAHAQHWGAKLFLKKTSLPS
jgi:hypothetical protein